MSERSKYLDTVLKLNRLTQDDVISWEHRPDQPPPETRGGRTAGVSPDEYVTEQKGKHFVLYRTPDARKSGVTGQRPKRAALEIRDPASQRVLFEFPPMAAVEDLYDTVNIKEADEVDAFLDEFLSEET